MRKRKNIYLKKQEPKVPTCGISCPTTYHLSLSWYIPCDIYLQIVANFFLLLHVFPQDGHTTWPDVLAFVCYLTHTVSANHYKIKHKKLLPKYFFRGIAETFKSIFSKTKIATYQNDRTVMSASKWTILGGFIGFFKEC